MKVPKLRKVSISYCKFECPQFTKCRLSSKYPCTVQAYHPTDNNFIVYRILRRILNGSS